MLNAMNYEASLQWFSKMLSEYFDVIYICWRGTNWKKNIYNLVFSPSHENIKFLFINNIINIFVFCLLYSTKKETQKRSYKITIQWNEFDILSISSQRTSGPYINLIGQCNHVSSDISYFLHETKTRQKLDFQPDFKTFIACRQTRPV